MNLLYVHTAEKVKILETRTFYTDGCYNFKVWERYQNFVAENGTVTFFSTIDEKKYDSAYMREKFNKIPPDIKVLTMPSLTKSIRKFMNLNIRKKIKMQIEKSVKESDVLIIRVPCQFDSYFIKCAKRNNKPYLLEVVGCVWDSFWNYNVKGKILAPVEFLKERSVISNAKYCVYVTNEFLQRRYPTKGKKTNCSNVILENINKNDLDNRLKKIEENENNIITIGTCAAVDVKYKGQDTVIRILPILKKHGYKIKYQMVGNGEENYLRDLARKYNVEDCVEFLGSIPHESVFKWYEKIDIYIQPSKQEGLPRALIEAMSKGCPALGTKVAGIPELLEKECVYRKGDLNKMTKIIEKFIEDKKYMKEQAINNFETSNKYKSEVINKRRQKFFYDFKEKELGI